MIITHEIINRNLNKLEEAAEKFPVLDEFKKSYREEMTSELETHRNKLALIAENLGLKEYILFIRWIERFEKKLGMKIIYDKIDFTYLKSQLAENAVDNKFKEYIVNKNRRGFLTFIQRDIKVFNQGISGSGRRGRFYGDNFKNTETLLLNYIIINQIDFSFSGIYNKFGHYYINELPNFEISANKELEITNDISKSIIDKLENIEYDFRKLNFNILKSEIESKIKQKMLTVEKGEQIRCIESQSDLTLNKVYNVISYSIGPNGSLVVYLLNDSGVNKEYNYRIFENVSKLRDDKILAIFNDN